MKEVNLDFCMEKYNDFMRKHNCKYNFENESPENHDAEASWLSQFIFKKMFVKKSEMHIRGTSTMSMQLDNSIEFSFDLMNNPKSSSKDFYRISSNAEKLCPSLLREWSELGYTIGNFTPIPNLKENGRHLQHKHRDVNERWDCLLNYCRNHWEDYSCSSTLSYNEYMKLTCQQIYFQEIYDDLVKKLSDKNLEGIDDQTYCKWIEEWDRIIDEKKNLTLLCFGEKSTEMKDIENIVKKICILIQVRGHMILASLSKSENEILAG